MLSFVLALGDHHCSRFTGRANLQPLWLTATSRLIVIGVCCCAPAGKPSDAVMIASTVSSKFISAMAAKEGFRFEETLTGYACIRRDMPPPASVLLAAD